jgi:GTP-binding protein Era
MYFPPEDLSDKPLTFMAGEIIREKALWLLQDEIPHGIGVLIQSFEEKEGITNIDADIVCEKDTHKEIIIGKDGGMLKEIGTKARIDIEKLLGKKVFLKLFVRVRKDWRMRRDIMNDLGYRG